MHTRRLLAILIGLSVSVSGWFAVSPAEAAPPDQGTDIFVVTFKDQSIEYSIARHAATDPAYRTSARELARSWITRLNTTGTAIPGLTGQNAATQLANITELNTHLTTGDLPRTEITKEGNIEREIDVNNPNTFPVEGYTDNSRLYWYGMENWIAGRWCRPSGCSEDDDDRYTSTITVNPGARATRIYATNRYFPDQGNFEKPYFEMWAINRGKVVGREKTGYLPYKSADDSHSSMDLNGTVLTTAVTLWIFVKPWGREVADSAKTRDATCRAKPDNACEYY